MGGELGTFSSQDIYPGRKLYATTHHSLLSPRACTEGQGGGTSGFYQNPEPIQEEESLEFFSSPRAPRLEGGKLGIFQSSRVTEGKNLIFPSPKAFM